MSHIIFVFELIPPVLRAIENTRKIKNPHSLFGTAGDLRAYQCHEVASVNYDYAYQNQSIDPTIHYNWFKLAISL